MTAPNDKAAHSAPDPLFLALAQPLLRGHSGELLLVTRGPGGSGIRAVPPQRSAGASPPRCYGHSQAQDALPWLATHERILALLDGHRPLEARPDAPWGGAAAPPLRPYPQCVSVQAGGLWFFFVNAAPLTPGGPPCVRIFAVDAQQAVECEPVPDACVLHAWEQAGELWACGLQPRQDDPAAKTQRFGQALRLRFSLKPFALRQRFNDARQLRVAPPLADDPLLPQRMVGVEAWWTSLPSAASPGERLLLGAPLSAAHYGDLSPLWWAGVLGAGEHADTVMARWSDGEEAAVAQALWRDRSYLARCDAADGGTLLFLLHTGLELLGQATPRQLRLLRWPANGDAQSTLADEPLVIDGLPPELMDASLVDLDAIHHPEFGHAATLSWLVPAADGELPGRCAGALLHSRDGLRWKLVQDLR
ncbi:hypothetical protein BURC_01004 [Burkholderiaceae bacterium]|nr:hypothetical protein BURC_01004 [Burkholderiaceae bacterium]